MRNMKLKGMVWAGLLTFGMLACANSAEKQNAQISGLVKNGGGTTLYLEKLTQNQAVPVDTTVVSDDGTFGFDHVVSDVTFYRVKINDQNFITLIVGPKEKVEIEGSVAEFGKDYEIKGSEESLVLKKFNNGLMVNFSKRDSLNQVFQANPTDQQLIQVLRNEFAVLEVDLKNFVRKSIDENPGSLASLAIIEQLNPDEDFASFEKLDKGLKANYGNTMYYNQFHAMFTKMTALSPGKEVPEITLPNPEGEMVSLSSLRGKVVLVDFWASWCKPCRAENPNVVNAYSKYHDKGFEIFSVSLDKDKASWLRAIEADNLTWTHVSDLKFWNSAVVKLYNISGIPFAVLIDQEGKIIAKNLRGPALHNKLDEIFN